MSGHIALLTTVDVYEQEGPSDPADALHQRVHRLREAGTPHKAEGHTVTWDETHEWGTRRTTIEYRDANQGVLDIGGLP